ncbi:MAG: phosphoenolpyruvate synthase [Pseudonocardiales bacterium]|nr:phosphoenolpyruvate synthase [Pseudonocardiales bacterium]
MSDVVQFAELGRGDVAVAGGKGANLGELTRAGLPVPPGFVLTTAAYRAFVDAIGAQILELAAEPGEAGAARIRGLITSQEIPDGMAREITEAWTALGGGPVAVRSSATAEDLAGASFAGQQDTYLNVHGAAALLHAVRDCWASLWTDRAMAYCSRRAIDPAEVALAVVVQEMVEADAAGVMFTANPTNGRRDELVVSAAWGLGESVVSGSVTTDDLVIEKSTLHVASRTTADKAVMTVYAGNGTVEIAVPPGRRTEPVLDDKAAAALAELGVRIEEHYGAPQDIEWARVGGEYFVVQARPITALPEPEAVPPTDWTVPDPRGYYFRASIVEQLPDPLSPLFAGLIDGSVERSLGALMSKIAGPGHARPGELGLPTVNGYAYYHYSRAVVWRMTASSFKGLKLLPSLGPTHWRTVARPEYVAAVAAWRDRPLDDLTDAQLLDGVLELLDAGTTYYTAVQSIIPIAASSEGLFTRFYDRLVRRKGDPAASTFLLGFDSTPILAEKSLYDLATWTRGHAALADAVRADPVAVLSGAVLSGAVLSDASPELVDEWRARWVDHLARYGHTTYNLDFLNPTPAEDPAPLFAALRFALDGGGTSPYDRQAASAARREELTAEVAARLDPARRKAFLRLLGWAQRVAPVREDALSDIGLAWPQMRSMIAVLGRRLVAAQQIAVPDDVYWLRPEEVRNDPVPAGAVAERKAQWRGRMRVTPPQVLPHGTVFDRMDSLFPAVSGAQTGPVLRGTGASAGQVTAPARVLSGPADFRRMRPGDVLVAAITTPAWTSLFTMAAAVVTDVGGPLSHSSIVAREYGIPAVLGTGVATRRITDGALVRVDGDAGTVTLLDEVDDTAREPAAADPGRRRVTLLRLSRSSATLLRRLGPPRGALVVGAAALGVVLWRRPWRRRGVSR